ncbi:aldehyde dehydrogenase [Ammoniphilus resinae]|uniref:Aldehyde dehydrogenase (NAD+) n=1 Tax=Ammoniphilus resinae TaxID=861532 RepID=A0ABS4GXT0_9BACL|nr:aldehyde dehydrogenase [Ammoniphilus resinae]MBP1934902.1 aldehyde dehydrogenase (NAD+) [Ammoniphilus resinae]
MGQADLKRYQMYIGGEFVDATDQSYIETINPYTGETWALIPQGNETDVDQAFSAARKCYESPEWRSLTPTKRGKLLRKLAVTIEQNAEYLAKIETQDNGKLFKEMYTQLKSIPAWFEYFAGLADKVEGTVIPLDRQSVLNYTLREPLGVVACITPWNSPLLLATWKLAPAIAAGNTVVLKPSEYTSASTLEFAKIFDEVGFPKGTLNVVTGYGHTVGDLLSKHPLANKVAFTGGGETGRKVAMNAVSHFAKVSLELGGKSPNIVFADADLVAAESGVIAGIFAASGQTCVAGSRLFVERSIADEFIHKLVNRAKEIKLGDPTLPDTQMGPAATAAQLRKIEEYVDIARSEGARVRVGGERPTDPELSKGLFYKPTILTDVHNSMRICQEEVFGPVLSVIPFDSEEEVIKMANDTQYGLGAGIWTNNLKRAHRMARSIESGIVWVNTYRATAFNSPFGGYKSSGIGRESGLEAIYDFMQTKSVWIELSDEISDPFSIRT